MRTLLIALTLTATSTFADATLSYTAEGSDAVVMTISVSGGRIRMDELSADNSTIIDPAAGTMTVIDHRQRTYILMDAEFAERTNATISDAQAQIEQALANVPAAQRDMVRRMLEQQQGASASPAAVPREITSVATGTSANFGGFTCQEMETRVDGVPKSRACLADPSAVGVSASDFRAIRAAFEFALDYSRRLTEGSGLGPQMTFPPIDGVMVQQQDLRGGQQRTISGIDGSSIPGDRFQPPAGYTQQDPLAGR